MNLFDEIKDKYNYSPELINILKEIYKGFCMYYGEDNIDKINDLFLNTQVIPYAFENGSDEKENLIRTYSDYDEEDINNRTIFEAGELLTKVIDDKVNKTVIVRAMDGEVSKDTIIHELIHGLVTCSDVKQKGEQKYILSGFSKSFLNPIKYTNNHYIEEGFTEYDTKEICKLIHYPYEESPHYKICVEYVSTVMDNPLYHDLFLKCRLDGINYIEYLEDEYVKRCLRCFVNNFESIYMNKNSDEKKQYFNLNIEAINQLSDKIKQKR